MLGVLSHCSGTGQSARLQRTTPTPANPLLAPLKQQLAIHAQRGSELFAAGVLDEAAAEFRQVLALEPTRVSAALNLAVSLHADNQLVPAVEAYRLVTTLAPDRPQAYLNMGDALRTLERPLEAAEVYTRGVTLQPTAQSFLNLGSALYEGNQLQSAAEAFGEAVRLDGDQFSPDAHNNLGLTMEKLGDRSAALGHFQRALILSPRKADTYANMADTYPVDERHKSIEALQFAIAIDPNNAGAYSNLANELRNQPARSMHFNKVIQCYGRIWYCSTGRQVLLSMYYCAVYVPLLNCHP